MSDLQSDYDETHEELAKANQRIAQLEAQRQEDADLIEAQKREIEVLHKIRDKAEELNQLKVDYDSLLEILADRCKKFSINELETELWGEDIIKDILNEKSNRL